MNSAIDGKRSGTMKFGLSNEDWDLLNRLAIVPLKQSGCKVFIFGSRARGDQKKFSDIDLLFASSTSLPLDVIGKIRSELEESDLTIKVDLVQESELANSFRDGVMKERIEV